MSQLSIMQMKELIEKFEELRQLDESMPQGYIDRLKRASELFENVRKMPSINWDDLRSIEDIERAEALIHQKAELKNEIEKHFNVCGMMVKSDMAREKPKRKLIRRSPEQIEFDLKVKELYKVKKKELGLPWKGKIKDEDLKKLDQAVEKELKKLR